MGLYKVGVDELHGELKHMLDNLQGEVFMEDFIKAADQVASDYEHWSR